MIKVLVYYNFSYPLGGGDYLPLTFVCELQKMSCVTLAVDSRAGFERALQCFNLPIDTSRINVVQLMPQGYTANKHTFIHSFIRNVRLKNLARDTDICISASNIIDFGRPAHHFINFLVGVDEKFRFIAKHVNPPRATVAQQFKHFLSETIFRTFLNMRSKQKIIRDPREHIYLPSVYVQKLMTDFYGSFPSRIFYPPTVFDPWFDNVARDPLRVIYLGRITPEKKLPDICEIVEKARALSGRDLKLIIAGPHDKELMIVKDILSHLSSSPWISMSDGVFGETKNKLLQSGTYAVHARRDEEFGISITEYLKAGLIPIVPDEGGACEVVDNRELVFHTNEEAATILVKLLNDPDFRESQRRLCADRAKVFTQEAYLERQRELLKDIVEA